MERTAAKATRQGEKYNPLTVDTEGLMSLLNAGRQTAISTGTAAGARIQVGRRVLWNVKKIQSYLDRISE